MKCGLTPLLFLAFAVVAVTFGVPCSWGQTWERLGPEGGQVISLAAAENGEVFLGTADGHIFVSSDVGQSWKIRGHLSERWDAVVQTMVSDSANPKRVFAGVWFQDPAAGGGVFWSEDGAVTWRRRGLEGEAVRALAQWPGDGNVLVAGTKTGVFRTKDAGETWERISPAGDAELRNLDSIAIDPRDANVIYAGTFHLPWKTTDGGKRWMAIADGMIDDSDVMSIAIDAKNPERIFASACSGIYRSESGGLHWTKLEGIPYASRRTQQILSDPAKPSRWFAGTTEGLWETDDEGETWERVLGRETSVNALVFPKPSGALILGSEDGVRVEKEGRDQFVRSERGFGHRVLTGSAVQGLDGKHLLVAFDAAEPAVLESTDGGATWSAKTKPKKSVIRLFAMENRWVAGLRGGGAAVLDSAAGRWKEWRFLRRRAGLPAKAKSSKSQALTEIAVFPEVRAVATVGGRAFVATDDGLWSGGVREGAVRKVATGGAPSGSLQDVNSQNGELLAVAGASLWKSADSGKNWAQLPVPAGAEALNWVRFVEAPTGRILLGTEKGVFLGELPSERNGTPEWRLLQSGLPATATESGANENGIWVISSRAGSVYVSRDRGATWERLEETTVGPARTVTGVGVDGIYVNTRADGLVKLSVGRVAAESSKMERRSAPN